MHQRTNVSVVYSFRTNRVVFFLLPLEVHRPGFERYIAQVKRVWAGQIKTDKHEYA